MPPKGSKKAATEDGASGEGKFAGWTPENDKILFSLITIPRATGEKDYAVLAKAIPGASSGGVRNRISTLKNQQKQAYAAAGLEFPAAAAAASGGLTKATGAGAGKGTGGRKRKADGDGDGTPAAASDGNGDVDMEGTSDTNKKSATTKPAPKKRGRKKKGEENGVADKNEDDVDGANGVSSEADGKPAPKKRGGGRKKATVKKESVEPEEMKDAAGTQDEDEMQV